MVKSNHIFQRIMYRIISIIIFLIPLYGQFGNVTVTMEHRLLKDNDRQELSNFEEEVKRFFKGMVWNEDYQDLEITLNIQFVFQGTAQKGGQKTYHAQALFSDGMDLRYFDKAVQFYYNTGGSIYYDPVMFDPLAGFLAYYGYMILAGQMDTYEFYGGTRPFEQARSIALRGTASDYPKGWGNRTTTLNEVLTNKGLREARFAYFLAMDLFDNGKVEESIKEFQTMLKGLEKIFMYSPRGRTLYFLRAHLEKLTHRLGILGQKEILTSLLEMDPENKETYLKVLKKIP